MIEILGISLEGYEIKHVVSTFFLSEENPKKIIRVGLKVIFKEEDKKNEKKQEKIEMKIFLKLNPNSRVHNEEDISYKLEKEVYKKGIGAEYEQVIPAKISEIKTEELSSNDLDLKTKRPFSHQTIKINFEINNKSDGHNKEANVFGILIRADIENEGIESESLLKRAMGLSKYAWNFHTSLWGEYENAYPHSGRNINSSEEVQTFLIVPDALYKSFGQINVLPGAYSIHIVKNKDVDSLSLERSTNTSEEEEKTEKEKIGKWYKVGSLLIDWQFGKTHRMSREVIVEHIESFPRLSMLFLIFSLLFLMSICTFSEDIYERFFAKTSEDICEELFTQIPKDVDKELFTEILENICEGLFAETSHGTSYTTFRVFLIFIVSTAILFIYMLINLRNYAFHEIKAPDEIASYIYYSCLLVVISFIPSSIFLSEGIENEFFTIFESIEYPATIIIILICSYVLMYRLTPWRIKKEFKKIYVLALLPIAALAVFALAVALASNYGIERFFISWAYLCAISVALLELREIFSLQSH